MYSWAGIIGVFYGGLFFLARGKGKGKAPPGVLGIFYPMASFLYGWITSGKVPIFKSAQVETDLKRLHPYEETAQLTEDYYVKKISLSLLICFLGTLFGVLLTLKAESERVLVDGEIVRGEQQEEQALDIQVSLESGEKKQFQVTVVPRQLMDEEAALLFTDFVGELPQLLLGENISIQEIRTDLLLEECYADYPFQVEWESSRPDIISSTGIVGQVEAMEEVVLTANVFYNELEWSTQMVIGVLPPVFSEEELLERELERLLEVSEKDSREKGKWTLPDTYNGKALVWKQVIEDNGPFFAVGGMVTAILIFILSDKDLHDETEKRKESMRRCYPDVVQKLVLYLSAGLTVRNAFGKMAGFGECTGTENTSNPVYEEICYTCRELQNGISEGIAYEHFARRTGVQEYFRLTTLLVQNLKKGNNTLLQRLREEAERANAEQLRDSRRLAEEASTKLLVPMVLLLLVVMLIIMFPAFSAVGV